MCVSLSTDCFVWRGLRYCGFVGLDFGYCRWQNQRKMRTTEFQTVFDMQRQQPEKIYCYYLSSLMLALNNGHMWVMPDGTISKPLCSSFLCWPAKFWEYCKKTRRNSSVFTGTDRSIRFDFKKSSPYSRVDLVAFAAPTNNGSFVKDTSVASQRYLQYVYSQLTQMNSYCRLYPRPNVVTTSTRLLPPTTDDHNP